MKSIPAGHQLNFKKLRKPFLLLVFCFGLATPRCFAQNHVLDVGLRLQKTVNLYYENGITAQYTSDQLLSQRLYLGFSYVSSRLGTALGSNAIKQDNVFLSATYYFRNQRVLQPLVRLNAGYFIADLEEPMFDELPNSSILLSPEAGISFDPKSPFKINASFGFNVFTGDGTEGPGTLYPLFVQTSITWNILNNR